MDSALYGDETEYSVNGIVAGVRNVLTDMRFLVKSHNLFIKLSTLGERNQIVNELSNINTHLSTNRVVNVTRSLDQLKILLRTYNLRIDRQRYLDFNTTIDELCRKAVSLSDEIENVKNKLDESETTYTLIEEKKQEFEKILAELVEQKDSFSTEFDSYKKETSDFRDLANSAQVNSKTISNNLSITNEAKNTFDEFIAKIDERESQLNKQGKSTEEYNVKLEEFAKSYGEKLDEVQNLIEK